jgi:hypothetical protein
LALRESLRRVFAEGMRDPVKIDLVTQRPLALAVPGREDCPTCEQTGEMLRDLAALHAKLRLTTHERGEEKPFEQKFGIDHIPAILLRGVLNRPALFFGEPSQHLFEPFLEALMLMSRNESALPPDAAKKLKRLHEPVRVMLFVDPLSPACGPMTQLLFSLAIENKNVHPAVYVASEFPRLAQRFMVQATPMTVFDGRSAFVGIVDPSVFVDNMLRATATRSAIALPRGADALPFSPSSAAQEAAQAQNVRPSGLIVPR